MRTQRLAKSGAALGAAALLLTGCNALGGGSDGSDGGSSDGGDSAESVYPGVTEQQVYDAMYSWGDGCEIFGNIQPVQDFVGVEGGELQPEPDEGGTYFPGCEGELDLPASGYVRLEMVLQPYETEDEATTAYTDRVESLKSDRGDSSTEYADVQEGELGGDWSESYFWTGNDGGQDLEAHARQGNWVLFFYAYVSEDREGAYGFAMEDFAPYVTDEYLPEVNAEIAAKFEE